jgi:adenosylcobinamide-GDP ribazoletransferase
MPGVSPREEARAAAAAIAFLTRLPVPRRLALERSDVGRAAWAFPLVGAGVGAIVAGFALLADGPLPPFAAAVLALAAGLILTGALHLDALADSADGLGGSSREHSLEIMRDHSVGAFGAAAIALDLLLKASLLATLLEDCDVVASLVAAGALSRAVAPPLSLVIPYARPAAGVGAALHEDPGPARVAVALAIAAAIAVLATGADALVALAALVVLTVALGLFFRRWLGGVTGDTLGATIELAELTALAVLVARC